MKLAALAVLSALLICLELTSCSPTSLNGDSERGYETDAPELPRAAPYAQRDISCIITVSDGSYSATLSVVRTDGIIDAELVSPEALRGITLVRDAEGLRITPPSGEVLVTTDEGAAGLCVFFDVLSRVPDEGERDGSGMYSFSVDGFDVTLLLSEDGLPRLITAKKDGVTRYGEVTFTESSS